MSKNDEGRPEGRPSALPPETEHSTSAMDFETRPDPRSDYPIPGMRKSVLRGLARRALMADADEHELGPQYTSRTESDAQPPDRDSLEVGFLATALQVKRRRAYDAADHEAAYRALTQVLGAPPRSPFPPGHPLSVFTRRMLLFALRVFPGDIWNRKVIRDGILGSARLRRKMEGHDALVIARNMLRGRNVKLTPTVIKRAKVEVELAMDRMAGRRRSNYEIAREADCDEKLVRRIRADLEKAALERPG